MTNDSKNKTATTYADAGVDIDAGNEVVERINRLSNQPRVQARIPTLEVLAAFST